MKQFESLEACLQWLEQLHPVEIELGLARIGQVAQNLGVLLNPTSRYVSFAGTNGKGSAVAMTEAALLQLGKTVGCYTSPHIFVFNERVRINGKLASDADLLAALEAVESARAGVSLTYFEYTTLAALLIFKQYDVDYVLMEVGLGGRLDATNVVDADIAVVTSIALDHKDWLGDCRSGIAKEKLGIARPGKKLLITELDPPEGMHDSVEATKALPCWIKSDCDIKEIESGYLKVKLESGDFVTAPAQQSLSKESLLTALQVIEWLDLPLNSLDLQKLTQTQLCGRFQQFKLGERQIVLDVAHNTAAAKRLAERLLQFTSKPVRIVFAIMSDKDIADVVRELSVLPVCGWDLPALDVDRAMAPAELAKEIGGISSVPITYRGVSESLDAIDSNECLLICGSFYTVASGLSAIQEKV